MPRMLAVTETRLVSEFQMSRERTAEDLRKLIRSYDESLKSPMLDIGDKAAVRKLREELAEQLADLEKDASSMFPSVSVRVNSSGCELATERGAVSTTLDLRVNDGVMRPHVAGGSGPAIVGSLPHMMAMLNAASAVLEVSVWALAHVDGNVYHHDGRCPCDVCSGKGTWRGNPCAHCGGKGKR